MGNDDVEGADPVQAPKDPAVAAVTVATPELDRRRLDEIFGDVLPDSTRDDQPAREEDHRGTDAAARSGREGGSGLSTSQADTVSREADMLRDVPPHHDR